jgi:hypothetical protein
MAMSMGARPEMPQGASARLSNAKITGESAKSWLDFGKFQKARQILRSGAFRR